MQDYQVDDGDTTPIIKVETAVEV